MLYDDPKAEKFVQEVGANAAKYVEANLAGPMNTMAGALDRISAYTEDDSYRQAGQKITDALKLISQEAANRAEGIYVVFNDPGAEGKDPESALDPGALKSVNEGWQSAARLSHTNRPGALDAQAIVRRTALQLQPLLDAHTGADAFDAEVLDPAARKHLQ
jgi:hypothetical protein